MNVSRKDIYGSDNEEGNGDNGNELDNLESQNMLERMLNNNWSNVVEKVDKNKAEVEEDVEMNDNNDNNIGEISFKLLSNAPINNLNLNSNVDNVLQPNDDEVKNFNDYQKKLKYRRPTVNEINERRLKIEATAVDFDWVINQSKVYWPSSREPPSREQSTSKSQELSSISLIKTDIKDDEFGKDKQGLVFDPYVQKINVKPTKDINTSKKSKKIKRARKLPAFFAPHPDQVKYSGAKAYFYDKPSSRPFNTLEDAPHAVRKYIRGDKRGITLDMENKRIMEKERELRRAEELEKKFKEKDIKRKVGRGKGNGDLGVSRVEKFSKHQTK